MSWLSEGISKVGDAWNSQPTWARAAEIGGAAALTGGLGLAAFAPSAIGLEAGGLGGFAGIGEGLFGGGAGGASTLGGIDAITTGSAVGAAQAGGLGAGAAGAASPYAGLYMGSPDVAADLAQDAAELNDPAIWGSAAGSPVSTGAAGASAGGAAPSAAAGGAAADSPWSLGGIASSLAPKNAGQALGAVAGVGGLGYNLYQGYQQKQELNKLNANIQQQSQTAKEQADRAFGAAQPQLAMGQSFENYLATNTLPPNVDQQLAQMQKQQEAQIISGYANRGMAADPNQNSALAGDLANAHTNIQNLRTQIEQQYAQFGQQAIQTANQLIAQGLSATQISAQLPMTMMELNVQLGQQTANAISSFARGLTPMGGGQKFQLTPAQ